MDKKVKIPAISPARRVIFEAHGEEEYRISTLHASLYTHPLEKIKKRAASIPVPWVDLEVTGNEIIKAYYECENETRRLLAEMAFARDKWADYFFETFKAPIRSYWKGYFGLDVCRLDSEIIRPPDGISTYDYVRQQHGEQAVTMLRELIHGIKNCEGRVATVAENNLS